MKILPFLLVAAFFTSHAHGRPETFDAARSILGQPDFTSEVNSDPPTKRSLYEVDGVAVDPTTGKLFVSDSGNHRILRFSSTAAYQTFAEAEAVFGQADFVSNLPNRGGAPSEFTLDTPTTLAFDAEGNLWVGDGGNARVLRYDNASSKPSLGAAADGVVGQPDFMSVTPATNSVDDSGFIFPGGVAVDAGGNLYVSNSGGIPRVLRFADAANRSGDIPADSYLGEVDADQFITGTSATAFSSEPYGLAIGLDGSLWVADAVNHRVLRFETPAVTGSAATVALGQPDLDSDDEVNPPTQKSMDNPYYVTIAPDGTLWVSDYVNYRVLGFIDAEGKASDDPADIVLGQPNFTTESAPSYSDRATVNPSQVAVGQDGSLFIGEFGFGAHVKRWSDPVALPAPVSISASKSVKTRKSSAKIKGTAVGAATINYKVAGQRGIKSAKGSATNWNAKIRKLTKKKTKVVVTATAADGRSATTRVKVKRKPRR